MSNVCPDCGTCVHKYARPYSITDPTLWCFECGAFLMNYPGHETFCVKEVTA
jgi:hypothetical protein